MVTSVAFREHLPATTLQSRKRRVCALPTLVFCGVLSLSACGVVPRGVLYTDTIQPLCTDLRGTTLGSKVGRGDSKRIEIPTTSIDLTAEWDSRAIGDIAKQHGITTACGCDSRRQSFLFGIWRRDQVIVYGD